MISYNSFNFPYNSPLLFGAPCWDYIGVRDCPYGICCPWVRGGWGLEALGKFFRRRPRPLLFRQILDNVRYVRLQSDNSLSLFSLLGTWTENVARVLIKILANGDYYIYIIINYLYRTIMKINLWVTFLI